MPFQNFRQIIDLGELQIPINTGVRTVIIREASVNTNLTSVYIRDIPADSFVIKIQVNHNFRNQFLNIHNNRGINKSCDGILIAINDGVKYCIFCELKSVSYKPRDYEYQLINAKLIIDYFKTLLRNFYNDALLENLNFRYILVYRDRIPKAGIRSNNPMTFSDEHMIHFAERIKKIKVNSIAVNNIHFNQLI